MGLAAWIAVISSLHGVLNLAWWGGQAASAATQERYRVGFLPVTCHLTCPVTDFINKQTTGHGIFEPVRFGGWPELKEAFLAGYTPATFLLAPMAMALRHGAGRLSCHRPALRHQGQWQT